VQQLTQGQAVCTVFCPAGPLLEYMPDKVKQPPSSTDELLAWTRANRGRFFYARPANSGPGRCWLQGLPYLLGDKNPKDPKDGWEKTWSYLEELGKNIEYYPTGTAVTMKELAEGSRDMIVTMTGWDINPRALGVVPKEAKIGTLRGFHWATDAQFFCVPKGVSQEKLAVLLDLTSFMLTLKAQAYTYDKGYFYPGPGGEGRAALDGAEGEPGRDQGVRPSRIRQADRGGSDGDAAAGRAAGLCVPALGPADRRQGGQEMTIAARDFRELRLDGISRDFGTLNALKQVSLTVKRGEFIALLGPSGCGKSTALNCLAGLLPLTAGSIWLDEKRIDLLGPEQRGFGMVFQNYALFPHMTVRRSIALRAAHAASAPRGNRASGG
jgi:ABC-type multidrug transport system fused ATPase/permease subunit